MSLLFGVAVLLFFGLFYRGHISCQEQFQLFLYDAAYWWERVSVPGGVADWFAEYLTQYYYHVWAGAAILAVLYVLLQRLVWRLAASLGAKAVYYPLSFVPVLLLWYYMGSEDTLLSLPVALLVALLFSLLYPVQGGVWRRLLYASLGVPLLYWAAGPVHVVFALWVAGNELRAAWQRGNVWNGIGVSVALLVGMVLCPLLASLWVQYPLYRLAGGINYFRFPMFIPVVQVAVVCLTALFPFVPALLPEPQRRKTMWGIAGGVLVFAGGGWLVGSGVDMAKEEALTYDYLVRTKQWHAVIEKAEKKKPTSPFSVTCLNLALAKTGQLGDRMFAFYQNGLQGLLPEFERDFISPLPASEAFYHLGMVNTAQRYVFEAMEAIPNYRKSGRFFKRLAETNLINGQYEVAAKYLRALQKTKFYKEWADETMTYLYDEKRINAHPEWGWIRQARYTEDFLFSDSQVDMMLGIMYERNHRNRMAFEYLMAYVLLKGDLEHFMKYYPLGKDAGYTHIPRSYQEALVYVWTQSHSNFKGMPWSISQQVMQRMADFIRIFTSRSTNMDAVLEARFPDTYWHYLYKQSKKEE